MELEETGPTCYYLGIICALKVILEIVGHNLRIIRNSIDILDNSDSRLFNFLFHMDQ